MHYGSLNYLILNTQRRKEDDTERLKKGDVTNMLKKAEILSPKDPFM